MSYVAPALREKFETLSIEIKNSILERDVRINTIQDLIDELEQLIIKEEKTHRK